MLSPLVDIIHSPSLDDWEKRHQEAFEKLFGDRYPKLAYDLYKLRAPTKGLDIPYAAYIHPSNAERGAYAGLSFVMFPAETTSCLFGLVVGTQGLSPDEAILGRPGHARKARAICDWLAVRFGAGQRVSWARQDPTQLDVSAPTDLSAEWPEYRKVFEKYGKAPSSVLYALYRPTDDRAATETALAAFLDLLFEERNVKPMAAYRTQAAIDRAAWSSLILPDLSRQNVAELLRQRRFVILQGPPGTGKTRMAEELLRGEYARRGRTIQFHPNSTYESFIGGLAPVSSSEALGLRFAPQPGALMRAAAEAAATNEPFLLHIDEINRADLGKILGEAIYLLEPDASPRTVDLPLDFGPSQGSSLELPPNLHILGTMNSSDRSIAILDVAVRRRFAFASLWPQISVVQQHGGKVMQAAFQRLLDIFIDHAPEDAFALLPGHSYFLEQDDARAKPRLRVTLAPLLEEYLAQGYVSGFAEQIRSYLQWLRL